MTDGPTFPTTARPFLDALEAAARRASDLALGSGDPEGREEDGLLRELAEGILRLVAVVAAAPEALDVAWGFAAGACSEFCVHGLDRPEDCPQNSPQLIALDVALAALDVKEEKPMTDPINDDPGEPGTTTCGDPDCGDPAHYVVAPWDSDTAE